MLGGRPLLAWGVFVIVLELIVTRRLIAVFLPKFNLTKRLFRAETDPPRVTPGPWGSRR